MKIVKATVASDCENHFFARRKAWWDYLRKADPTVSLKFDMTPEFQAFRELDRAIQQSQDDALEAEYQKQISQENADHEYRRWFGDDGTPHTLTPISEIIANL